MDLVPFYLRVSQRAGNLLIKKDVITEVEFNFQRRSQRSGRRAEKLILIRSSRKVSGRHRAVEQLERSEAMERMERLERSLIWTA